MKKRPHIFQSAMVRTLSGGFLLVIVPVLLLCSLSGYWAMQNLRTEVENSYQSNIQLISSEFSERLRQVQLLCATLFVDDEVVSLSAGSEDQVNLWKFGQFQERLKLNFSSQFFTTNVLVIFPKQDIVVSLSDGVERLEQYPSLSDLGTGGQVESTWRLRPSYRNPDSRALSHIMGYIDPSQSRPIVVIEIDENVLTNQLNDFFQENVQVQASFFIDPTGNTACRDAFDIADEGQLQALWQDYRQRAQLEPRSVNINGHKFRIVPAVLENFNCMVGIMFDEGEVLMPVTHMIWLLILILLFGTAAGIGYLFLSYRRIYAPVRRLVKGMDGVAKGDFSIQVTPAAADEIGLVTKQFNRMVSQLDTLLKERYLSEVKLKKAQYRFLQSQINPHFLYNSLFGLYNMIKSDQLDEAADLSIYLGQYYQISAQPGQQTIPLEREMENIRLYLKIHQIRMAGKLTYDCSIQPGFESFLIPSLSLQTLVENAVTHAFQKFSEPGILEVRAYTEEGFLLLRVKDNGSGLQQQKLREILQRMEQPEQDDNEIHGVENVYRRLLLMFGESAGIKIEPVTPHGTSITMCIPIKDEGAGRV